MKMQEIACSANRALTTQAFEKIACGFGNVVGTIVLTQTLSTSFITS